MSATIGQLISGLRNDQELMEYYRGMCGDSVEVDVEWLEAIGRREVFISRDGNAAILRWSKKYGVCLDESTVRNWSAK
jgi:hypothetical protein